MTKLNSFLDLHGIHKVFQSGFRSLYGTETAPLKVFNDLLLATDSRDCAILILVDLTAAFDTVDHKTLILLGWFRFYLSEGTFSVNFVSSTVSFTCGVPKGSILGPILFSLYILPLRNILESLILLLIVMQTIRKCTCL